MPADRNIPKPDHQYDIFVNGLMNQVVAKKIKWGIPGAEINKVILKLGSWNNSWSKAKHKMTRNSVKTKRKNMDKASLTMVIRPFLQRWIFLNNLMTDADVISCGLKPHKKTKTRSTKPKSKPWMHYELKNGHRILAYFRQQPNARGVSFRRKPDGVKYIKIAIYLGDNPPADVEKYSRKVISTVSPVDIKFKATDAGKKVYIAGCWMTGTALQGDWTRPQVMTIP